MKVYEVEYRAVITLAAQDMQEAELHGVTVIKDNPHLISVRAVQERNFEQGRVAASDSYGTGKHRLKSRQEL